MTETCNFFPVATSTAEERFRKSTTMKLNHMMNLLKSNQNAIQKDENDDLLPDFPLTTTDQVRHFQRGLHEPEIKKQWVNSNFQYKDLYYFP